jgi:hypothetical protein
MSLSPVEARDSIETTAAPGSCTANFTASPRETEVRRRQDLVYAQGNT